MARPSAVPLPPPPLLNGNVVRSSGRILKEIPIVLIGSDLDGTVFSEQTKTLVLSLNGARVVSRHKLSPEQELVLRWPARNREAEICVVGQIGPQSGGYTYGVAFSDPYPNFWEVEFPPLTPAEIEAAMFSLVCSSCKTVEKLDDSAILADVCTSNEGVLRYCKRCGSSTLWKPAASDIIQESVSAEAAPLPLPPLEKPPSPRVNRRQHARVKVAYSACVRHPQQGDEVVLCEDMSKGGLRFKSRRQYYAQSLIEVSVPYQSGQSGIFVSGLIVFVQELPEQCLFRYGIQYLNPTKPRDAF